MIDTCSIVYSICPREYKLEMQVHFADIFQEWGILWKDRMLVEDNRIGYL